MRLPAANVVAAGAVGLRIEMCLTAVILATAMVLTASMVLAAASFA